MKSATDNLRNQFIVLGVLSIGVLSGAGLLSFSNPSLFQRFLGNVHPLVAIGSSIILGFGLLFFLLSKGWFTIYTKHQLNTGLPYVVLTLLFASVAILIDINIVYPKDMNIPFPESTVFYPVIAFLAEILFHVLPLTLFLVAATIFFRRIVIDRVVLTCILIVALFEPTYQVIFMETYAIWAMVAVWVNLFFFNTTQLFIFRKYGFISMYALRLLYYLIWHVIWGVIRLEFLF